MSYTAADSSITAIYTNGTWNVETIDTGDAVVTEFLNTAGGVWEAGVWVAEITIIDLNDVMQMADSAEAKATSALAGLATESLRAQTEEGKKLNKNAIHTNGITQITNDDANNGLSVVTNQNDTQTNFRIETNTEEGNPVIGGMIGRTAASGTTGSRRLLFVVDSGGNIKIHLRKDKPAPTQASDLNDGDLILNKGEIQAIVNDIMAALSQGLKTPALIDKESELPDASEEPNGTYYVVQDLDVTAPGQQGRVWKNDVLSETAWQVVIDNVFAPDEEWVGLTAGGALTLTSDIQALINGAVAVRREQLQGSLLLIQPAKFPMLT